MGTGKDTILDVFAKLRNDDPSIAFQPAGEPVSPGKFVEFELVDWNGKPRFVPIEALSISRLDWNGTTDFIRSDQFNFDPAKGRSYMYRGQVAKHQTCVATLFRGIPAGEWQIKGRLTLERFRVAELEHFHLRRDHDHAGSAESAIGRGDRP